MSQQIIAEFESRFIQTFLHQQAMTALNSLELDLSEESVEKVINILLDLGFADYIITNTFKLELDEEKYLQYASKMLELFKLQSEMEELLGGEVLYNLTKTAGMKAQQWIVNHEDALIDSIWK